MWAQIYMKRDLQGRLVTVFTRARVLISSLTGGFKHGDRSVAKFAFSWHGIKQQE